MLEVVHIISGLQTGGAEMMLAKILPSLKARGFNATIVSLSPTKGAVGSRIAEAGFPVHYLDMKHRPVKSVLTLRALLVKTQPAVVQGWLYHGNLLALVAAAAVGMTGRLAWSIRSSLYDNNSRRLGLRMVVRLNAWLSRWPRVVLFNSKVSLSQHVAYGFGPRQSELIENGFDGEKFKPDPAAKSRLCAELGLPDGTILIGCVGRCHPDKDYPNLFQAIEFVGDCGDSSAVGGTYYVLVGKGLEPGSSALDSLSDQVKKRVVLLGERHDLDSLMPAFDMLVLPSKTEAFPNVVGEAMASGVPCVATEVGESAAIIGDTGFVVPPQSPKALAAALIEMMSKSKEERAALGRRARQRILSTYSLDLAADKITSVYRLMSR